MAFDGFNSLLQIGQWFDEDFASEHVFDPNLVQSPTPPPPFYADRPRQSQRPFPFLPGGNDPRRI